MWKKKLVALLLAFSVAFALMPTISHAESYECAWFPAPVMNVNQLAYESYSHGDQNAIDILPGGDVFAPFTGRIVYKDPSWGYVILQSLDKVYYADGSLDYMSAVFMHDSDISNLSIGQVIKQGDPFYQAGGMGWGNPNEYGVHVHLAVYRGQVSTPITGIGNGDVYAFNAFFINTSRTPRTEGKGKGVLEPGNYITQGGYSNWTNLWRDLSSFVPPVEKTECTVTFDPDGGHCSAEPMTVPYGGTLDYLPRAYMDTSAYFEGWYTAPGDEGQKITADYKVTSDMTFYAHWLTGDIKVRFHDITGAVWKEEDRKIGYNSLTSEYPELDGYYFSGWTRIKGSNRVDMSYSKLYDFIRSFDLYPVYLTKEEVTSGKPVLLYWNSGFDSSGYDVKVENVYCPCTNDSSRWSEWSDYDITPVTASEKRLVKTAKVYRYYYFLCPSCGAHEPYYGTCDCNAQIPLTAGHIKWSTIPYSQSDPKSFSYTNDKLYTTSLGDGEVWIFSAGNLNDTEIGTRDAGGEAIVIETGYRYRELDEKYTEGKTEWTLVTYTPKTVTLSKIEILSKPSKLTYEVGESLNTTGLKLKATYSDNSTQTITSGFTTSGFSSDSPGTKTVTVNYQGKTAKFDVTVKAKSNTPKIVVATVNGKSGSLVQVKIMLEKNPGIASLKLKVTLDPQLTVESVVYNESIGGMFMQPQTMNSPMILNWFNGAADLKEENPLFATLNIRISSSAKSGSTLPITVSYEQNNVYNIQEEDVYLEVVNGAVKVADYLCGDMNGNGIVDNKDLTRLFQYLSSYSGADLSVTGDVNNDGKVDNKDLTRLFQYLSGWQVQIY